MRDKPERDPITEAMGDFGRWQFRVTFVISWLTCPVAWHFFAIQFLAPPKDHWCARTMPNNITVEQWKEYAIPHEISQHHKGFSKCLIFSEALNPHNFLSEDSIGESLSGKNTTCTSWEYDLSTFGYTLTDKWNMVCDREWLSKTSQAAFFLGVLISCLVLGQVADKLGRKTVMVHCLVASCIIGCITVLVDSIAVFMILRFMIAFTVTGTLNSSFVYCMEVTGGTWRTIVGLLYKLPISCGIISMAGLAYLFRDDWRIFQLTISIIPVVFIVLYWMVPESPRWLLSQGRVEEARNIFRHIAHYNGRELKLNECFDRHVDSYATLVDLNTTATNNEEKANKPLNLTPRKRFGSDKKATVVDIFKSSVLRRRTFILCFNWLAIAFVYFGLSLNTHNLAGNEFINFMLTGFVEFPGYIGAMLVILRWGRRWPQSLSLIISGVCCLLTIAIPRGMFVNDWPVVTLAMIGKLHITASFGIIYMLSAEIYPTVVRNVGLGTNSLCARVGAILSPYVILLGQTGWRDTPVLLFAAIAIIAGCLILLLPETKNRKLPDTLQEGESFGRDKGRRGCVPRC